MNESWVIFFLSTNQTICEYDLPFKENALKSFDIVMFFQAETQKATHKHWEGGRIAMNNGFNSIKIYAEMCSRRIRWYNINLRWE